MSGPRPPRITVGIIIEALEARIVELEKVKPGTPEYGETTWKIIQLREQIEALKWRPTADDVGGWGGSWLGTLRTWVQSNFRNGSDVTWGGNEPLIHTSAITSGRLERLAAQIAAAAVRDHMGPWLH